MTSAKGFRKEVLGYTASQVYEKDGIFPDDVALIAKLKGFQSPFSENQRTQIKEFVKQAKANSETINQAVQAESDQSAPAPNFEPAPAPASDPMDAVTNKVSTHAQQDQRASMQVRIDSAITDWAVDETAKNLAIAQMTASGGDLSKYPVLEQMVDQSKNIRRAAEAANPALLPFQDMLAIAFAHTPMLNGKLLTLPATATLVLPAISETVAI